MTALMTVWTMVYCMVPLYVPMGVVAALIEGVEIPSRAFWLGSLGGFSVVTVLVILTSYDTRRSSWIEISPTGIRIGFITSKDHYKMIPEAAARAARESGSGDVFNFFATQGRGGSHSLTVGAPGRT